MARKRKDYYRPHDEIPNINDDDPRILYNNVDRNEIMRLTKMAKSWEFTCSFCFKKFPSAQAMGGHQNAHRNERVEEKRRYIRDPIGYRKRAYIQAMKELAAEQSSTAGRHASKQQVALKFEFVNINGPPKILQRTPLVDFMEFNAVADADADHHGNNTNNITNNKNYFCHPSFVVMNFLPPKELSLAESVGVVCVDDHQDIDAAGGKGCMDLDQMLDLTLKL